MNWQIEFTRRSRKDLEKLSCETRRRIVGFLKERAAAHTNPRVLAKRLTGVNEEVWCFRVGDYGILVIFEDDRMVILVIEVGHRREIYRG